MQTEILERSLAGLRTAADDGAMHEFLEATRYALLRRPEASEELAGSIGATAAGTEPDEAALALFSAVLDAARMAAENDQLDGQRLLDAVEARLGALAGAGALTTTGRLALGSAFVRAGLPASPHLEIDPDELDLESAAPHDVGDVLESLREGAGSDPAALHESMSRMLAAMPAEVRVAAVGMVASRPEEVFARAGAYWLLDRDAGLRRAAAEGMRRRAEAGALDAATAARMTLVRPWLPADAARDALDQAIRAALGRATGALPKPWRLHRTVASIPDGTGSQSIAVAAQSGGRRAVAMLLLKQGFGVKDAFVAPCDSASEQRRLLATVVDEMGAMDVSPGLLGGALAAALGEALPPAPALIDVAEICGLDALRPQARSVAALIADIDPEGRIAAMDRRELVRLLAASADWVDRYPVLDSWFEDSSAVREILAGPGKGAARLRAVRAALEDRRGWWSRIIGRAAATLRAAGDPAWREFAATAHALENGEELKKVPIMEAIAERTLDEPDNPDGKIAAAAAQARREPEPEKPGEFARMLKGAEVSPDWVEGFLTAVVVAPRPIRPGEWIKDLMARMPEFRGHEHAQRGLDIITLRYNDIVHDIDDAERMKQRIGGRRAAAASAWAGGFTAVVDGFAPAWKDRSLGKTDKAMLNLLAEAAVSPVEAARLDLLLPEWLVRRYRLAK